MPDERQPRALTDEEQRKRLAELVSFDDLRSYLGLQDAVQVHVLMSELRMPGWLVGGVWKFHRGEIDGWLAGIGGRERVAQHLAGWEKRRAEAGRPGAG